jgi:D-alanyl-D-alanine carboxypeptidase
MIDWLGGPGGDWSVVAYSIDSGRTLIAINPSAPRTPASNNKVFTSSWAL